MIFQGMTTPALYTHSRLSTPHLSYRLHLSHHTLLLVQAIQTWLHDWHLLT